MIDPAIAAVVEAYETSGQPYLIVNEDHDVDWHRHVSACILDTVSERRPMVLGGEDIPQGFHSDLYPSGNIPGSDLPIGRQISTSTSGGSRSARTCRYSGMIRPTMNSIIVS